MEIKLGKIFIPIFIGIIIISFITTLFFVSSSINDVNDNLQAEIEANSKQKTQKNVELLHKLFRTIQPTINSTTSQIHRNITGKYSARDIKNFNNNPIHSVNTYKNYTYNYSIFSRNNSTNRFEYEFSSFGNVKILDKINSYSYDILRNDKSTLQKLSQNRIVNKIAKFNNVLYLVSFGSNLDINGSIVGANVVFIALNDFVRINDFIYFNDAKTQVDLFDGYQKVHIYNSSNNIFYQTAIYNIDSAMARSNKIYTRTNINKSNLSIYSATVYYDFLDIIIASRTEYHLKTNIINKLYLKQLKPISYTYITIIIVVFFIITLLIKKCNDVINNKFLLLKYIVNCNYNNILSIISNINKKPFKYIWNNFNETKEVIKNIEDYLLKFSNENPDITRDNEFEKNNFLNTVNNTQYYLNKIINAISDIEKNQSIPIISQLSNSAIVIKNNNLLFSQNYNKIIEFIKNYNELEVSFNIISLNLTILCCQINDNRLNELLLLVQKINRKLQNVNDEFEKIYFEKNMESDVINSEFIKIENNIDLINAIESKKINTLNNVKKYVTNAQSSLNNQGENKNESACNR